MLSATSLENSPGLDRSSQWGLNAIGRIPFEADLISPYGDPELALIYREEEILVDPVVEAQIEARHIQSLDAWDCIKLFSETDRIILSLRYHGWPQIDIAAVLGLSQPSVCNRIIQLREWFERNVPLRARVREAFPDDLPSWLRNPKNLRIDEDEIWRRVVLQHEYPARLGHPQPTVAGRIYRWLAVASKAPEATDEQREVLQLVLGCRKTRLWCVPYVATGEIDASRRQHDPMYGLNRKRLPRSVGLHLL